MKKLVVSETVRASRDIFIHHTSKYPEIDFRCKAYRKKNIRVLRDPSPLRQIQNIPSTSSQNAIFSFINDGHDAGIPSTGISPAVDNLSFDIDRPTLDNVGSPEIFTTTQVENLIVMTDFNQQPASPINLSGNSASYPQELFENLAPPTTESLQIPGAISISNSPIFNVNSASGVNQALCQSNSEVLSPPTSKLSQSQAPVTPISTQNYPTLNVINNNASVLTRNST